ncbi:uncharacterized protein LOC104581510 isoform X3 [Brachypodium distachyon]|uniref:SANT domain-containing protein n=1 Tax=Brachypodium distachyon TaxID=15368 RepID=I1GX13_BRADI|nr:uncharacterized protein LOC104581510 isoform X3 [Brachypodium distachyon]KQK17543.1 hypothetical protein BRADI_1g35190v3 [Brachypodium distachyon]PNT75575.1 hypothetical protein BRADI_1g35190v3 [Brachypodium distachyon]|eukprot:XP_010227475.1 uncharacterized protein LOC104581510 isoform X3 [Brachypodium distachyon]
MIDDEADLANIADALEEDVQAAAKFRPKPRAKSRKPSMASRSQLPNPRVEKPDEKVEASNQDNLSQEITPSTLPASEITGAAAAASEGGFGTLSDDVSTVSAVGRVSPSEDRSHDLSEVHTHQGNLVVSDSQASSSHLGGKTIDDLADFEGLCDSNAEQERVAKFKPKNQLKLSKAASKSRKVDQKAVASTIDVASQSKDTNQARTDQEPVHTSDSQTSLGTSNSVVDNLADQESILEEPVQEETVAKIVSESRDVVSQDARIDSPDEVLTSDIHPKPRDQEAIAVPDSWPPQDDTNIDLDSQEELINHHIDDTQQIVEEPSAEATAKFQPNVKRKKGKGKSVTFILPNASDGVAPADTSSEWSNINHYCNDLGADESLNNLLEQTAQKHSLAERQHSNDQECTNRESQYHEGGPSDHAVEKQPDLSMNLRSRKKVLKVGMSEHTTDNNFDEDYVEPLAAEQDNDSGEEYIAGGKLKVRRKSRAKDTNKEPLRGSKRTSKDSTVEESQQQKLQKEKGEVTPRGRKRASKDTLAEQPAKKLAHRIRQKRTKEFRTLLEKPDHEIDRMKLSVTHLRLLQEARERIKSKTIPSGPSYSNQSSQFGDTDDFDPFGEYDNGRTENHMFENTKLNYHSYMNKQTRAKWSKTDTDLFYQGLQQFGSDFAMIQQLFPDKTRDQVRQKFKTEEKKHPMQVHDAILHRSRDNSYLKQVIKNLNIEDLPIGINKSTHKQEDTSNEVNPGNENMLDDIIDGEEENDPNWSDKGQGTQVGSEVEEAGEPVSSAKADPDLDVFDWY